VQVERKRVRVAGRTLKAGTEVRVAHDDALGEPPQEMVPVLFEDEWLLVVDKPGGMASQGTQASDRHDLAALLQRHRPDQMLALQHRLDQGTSGILVVAKHPAGHLGTQFQARTVTKTYLARVSRPLEAATVDLPIGRVPGGPPVRYGCTGELREARPARTDFRPASAEETAGLAPGHWVVAQPHTGRTHQIRVHLAHLGCPVLGDALYGGADSGQMWLHAWKLVLEHPVTGARMELTAAPARFLAEAQP
jgi:RluA family pseudouridine synthase